MGHIVNTHQAEAWNGYEGEHWAAHQQRWDAVSQELNHHLLTAAAIGEQDHVLDIGCGNGQSTRLAAARAHRGHALGVDLSAPMLAQARATAAAEGVSNVRFEHGDAQVYPFEAGGFDVAISRGGIMFFSDPVTAFANIGRALRPGGRLVFVCPRDVHRQDWFVAPMTALLGRPPGPAGPREPGMFSLADHDHLHDLLSRAGFETVTATGIDVYMTYGSDAADAAEFVLGMGPVRFYLDQTGRPAEGVRSAVTAALRPYEVPGGVRMPGSFWLVAASRPLGDTLGTSPSGGRHF
ncbi:class I SAM-dependent methyltransferase [Actinopolymorpha alba]|uniref:class I SAM-dependent methyltransferase n=1 Tax=Actinopolymorpha alba TaxID=533267 RepID=UPI000375F0FA|nr:class I SAM-dependent methyltransferase [Actinopolymorpha alba]